MSSSSVIAQKTKVCMQRLFDWGRPKIGGDKAKIRVASACVQDKLSDLPHQSNWDYLFAAKSELERLLLEEEQYWKQRS